MHSNKNSLLSKINFHFYALCNLNKLNFPKIYLWKYICNVLLKKAIPTSDILKIKKIKKIFVNANYSYDFASGNILNFFTVKEKINTSCYNEGKKIKILEIGSYEGLSANIFRVLFSKDQIVCCDPFLDTVNLDILEFSEVKKNFIKNIKNISCKLNEMTSKKIFNLQFNFFTNISSCYKIAF